MAFSFGTTQPSIFGTTNPTTSAPAGFTGFGVATSAPTFGGFGTATTLSTAASGFTGFGTGGTTGTGFTGFGVPTTTTTTGFTGFGVGLPTTTTASTGFAGFGTGFGAAAGTGATGFGTGFGKPGTGFGTGATGFGTGATGFGTGATGFGTGATGFGATGAGFGTAMGAGTGFGTGTLAVQQQQQQQQQIELANMAMAVSLPQIYGDERDTIMAKWNQLQAYWGTGKGFFSQNAAVAFKPDNPFCRFKAIGYCVIPTGKNEDGLVALMLKKKQAEVSGVQQQIVDTIHKILGSKPTLSVCVEGVRPIPEDRTELVIYVLERPASGPAKRVLCVDLFNFLNQANIKPQLSAQLTVDNIVPKMGWSKEQLKEYLDKPPAGIDPLLWQQAKLDNPDPDRLIPVPMIGFSEVQLRLKHQEEQTKLHQQRLDVMAEDLTELQTKHSNMLAKLEEYKRKHLELGHSLLQAVVKQEIYRKMGYAIQAEEEQLKVQLEALQTELNHPTQFKGRLNELMSQIRMQNQTSSQRSEITYQMDPDLQIEMKQMLKQQQEGLQHLIEIIKEDTQDLQLIEQGLSEPAITRR